jgi:hypothetical protein
MGTVPSNNVLGSAWARVAAMIAACAVLQCTYDFDRFDPAAPATQAQGGAAGQEMSVSDAAGGGPMADQSVVSVDATTRESDAPSADASTADSPSPSDAAAAAEASSDAGCGAACIGTAQSCAATCNATSDTCLANCTRATCRTTCMTTHATCLLSCSSNCQTCTRNAGCQQNAMCTAAAQ